MKTVICTLFEGHYHFGVAALTNSLYNQGYRGEIYVGYRGALPEWASGATKNSEVNWKDSSTMSPAKDLILHFLPLETNYHFANYKPNFMLELLDGPAKDATKIFYFDPDIVVSYQWKFYEEWVKSGVTLCEDVNSPLAMHHPRRTAWRKYFGEKGIALTFKEAIYANSGYVGITRENSTFLNKWVAIQEAIAPVIGGLNFAPFAGASNLSEEARKDYAPFSKTDQDAMNATVEAWDGPVSFIGQEAMALKPGAPLMSHALGKPKPWHWKPVAQALGGVPPRLVDRDYWSSAKGLINVHSSSLISYRKFSISVGAFIGRFYRRGRI
jgi:hypothetical protein